MMKWKRYEDRFYRSGNFLIVETKKGDFYLYDLVYEKLYKYKTLTHAKLKATELRGQWRKQ